MAIPLLHGGGTLIKGAKQSNGVVVNYGGLGQTDTGNYYAGNNFIVNAGVVAHVTADVGIYASTAVTLTNYGVLTISGLAGGSATVVMNGGGVLFNYGTISGIAGSLSLTNGSTANTSATVTGYVTVGGDYLAAHSRVTNFGTITGSPSSSGVLTYAGDVINGASGSTAAYIVGDNGVEGNPHGHGITAQIDVTNFATIIGRSGQGVGLDGPSNLTNGAIGSTTALIYGATDGATTETGTITNFGTIRGGGSGVQSGGTVTNGAPTDSAALISAATRGVGGASLVKNDGTIAAIGPSGTGVYDCAMLVNGVSGSAVGVVMGTLRGHYGGNVTNFGQIIGTGVSAMSYGDVETGGQVLNYGTIAAIAGTLSQGLFAANTSITNFTGALIEGSAIGAHFGLGTLANFGTIRTTGMASSGVEMSSGALINEVSGVIAGGAYGVNLARHHDSTTMTNFGLISGVVGVQSDGPLTNGGTITGTGGTAVEWAGAADLTLLPGAVFNGVAMAGGSPNGNFLTLATGARTGTLVGLGTEFQGFGAITVAAGARWAFDGVMLLAGVSLAVAGTLLNLGTIGGASGIALSGTLINSGVLRGAGATTVIQGGGGHVTVVNSGTIAVAGGTAIQLSEGPERLVITPTGRFVGAVRGGGAGNVLELAPGTSPGPGIIGGIGAAFVGFDRVAVDKGATWEFARWDRMNTLTVEGHIAVDGTLTVLGQLDPASTGQIAVSAGATLDVASVLGAGPTVTFLAGAKLVVENAGQFGINVGTSAYVGPLLHGFGARDAIDLKGFAVAQATWSYATAAGLLTLRNAGGGVASLHLDPANLGPGDFRLTGDRHGGTLITHG